MKQPFFVGWTTYVVASAALLADGPADNDPGKVRPIPPRGIDIPESVTSELRERAAELRVEIDLASSETPTHPMRDDLLPDVEIFWKAVDWAVRHGEIFHESEVETAKTLLAEGWKRVRELRLGDPTWLKQRGLVVRGYRSRIDDSVQPYGLVIPEKDHGKPWRLDVWFHGRNEKLSELAFIDQRRHSLGPVEPAETIVLHPYSRFNNGAKFAGETDLFEAVNHVQRFYSIDDNRIIVRGFSLGGAAAWHTAVHHADRWCGAQPGAGFSETPSFLKFFQNEDVSSAPWYQQKLWRWYNATDSALNLFHCPTVAYSGEIDRQRQAAEAMEHSLRGENLDLRHVIGIGTAHKLDPVALAEIEQRLKTIAEVGRDVLPHEVHFATWTLRYPRMHWVVIDELREHWERARVHGKIESPSQLRFRTQNIAALTLEMPSGLCPLHPMERPFLVIDEQELTVRRPRADRSWTVHLRRSEDGSWQENLRAMESSDGEMVKRHGLQGPIDDAFMNRFVMVAPSSQGWHPATDDWVEKEMNRAIGEWRRQFRGDALVRKDREVSDEDVADANLILWGDPGSNAWLGKIMDRLPIRWTPDALEVNGRIYPSATHLPAIVFPNPLNRQRYVVLNSGFTFRDYTHLNNARQVPQLPDWAVIDLSEPPGSQRPGRIADAGFFDEHWRWKPGPK